MLCGKALSRVREFSVSQYVIEWCVSHNITQKEYQCEMLLNAAKLGIYFTYEYLPRGHHQLY
jgi:hypothetical protein